MDQQHEPNQTYQTGRTSPPKSHRGIIAFLLALVIFLCGISTALGLMNIHLFRQLQTNPSKSEDALSFSRTEYDTTLPAEEPVCFGQLGFSGETVSEFWQQYQNLPKGIYVTDVTAQAADSGLRPGDIVLRFQGAATETTQALHDLLNGCDEDTAQLVICRDTRQYTLSIPVR